MTRRLIILGRVALILGALVVFLVRADTRATAVRTLLLGAAATAMVVAGVWLAGRWLGSGVVPHALPVD